MSTFKFYITDLNDGVIHGTNDKEVAENYASCEDYFIVNTDTGKMLTSSGDEIDIKDIENRKL